MRSEGDKGEAAARSVLTRAGFSVLAQNFSVRGGEIDIVARAPDGCIVFVEVKLRAREPIDHSSVVPRVKILRMRRAAAQFLSEFGAPSRVRYDLILLIPNSVTRRARVVWYRDFTRL
ncbi:MAG: YraN family protein [Candidatus Magasanikbacteria bacterium]|nr:YraN family protein [Candidatus Magasanikbacteria bacterium]